MSSSSPPPYVSGSRSGSRDRSWTRDQYEMPEFQHEADLREQQLQELQQQQESNLLKHIFHLPLPRRFPHQPELRQRFPTGRAGGISEEPRRRFPTGISEEPRR